MKPIVPLALFILLAACEPAQPPSVAPSAAPVSSTSSATAPAPAASSAPPAAPSEPAPAPDDEFAKVQVKAEKVAGAVYVLFGAGGNIGVSVGDDGIVIVDDQFAPLADKIKAALAGITDKPIRFVLNTHWHGDHTGGNAVFGRGAPIVAHDNVRKRLASGAPEMMLGKDKIDASPPAPREALPVVTFSEAASVHLNGEEIRMLHIEHAHTDGDSAVLFMRSNVVHMGDVYNGRHFPFIDRRTGGSVQGLIAGVKKLLHDLPPDVKVIPGHGNVATLDDVRRYLAAIEETRAIVAAAVKKKQSLADIEKSNSFAKYASYKPDEGWIETLYADVTGH